MNRFRSVVFVVFVAAAVSVNIGAADVFADVAVQETCVKIGQPTKDSETQMYSVPVNNECTYKVKVVVTNGGVNYGKILETTTSGQIVLGKSGAKEDYAVTWKKMS